MNLPNFWYGTSLNFDPFRGTNHTASCYSLKHFNMKHYDIILTNPVKVSYKGRVICWCKILATF